MDHHKRFHLKLVSQVAGKVIGNYNNDFHLMDETPSLYVIILLVILQWIRVCFELLRMVLKELVLI